MQGALCRYDQFVCDKLLRFDKLIALIDENFPNDDKLSSGVILI